MVQVRVRPVGSSTAVELGEIPLSAEGISSVLPLLRAWGVMDADGADYDPDETVAQFVVTERAAYLEVVLSHAYEA